MNPGAIILNYMSRCHFVENGEYDMIIDSPTSPRTMYILFINC